MARLNIAMDGPVGAGKSSIADAVAKRLGILHLDTGAMYRALGLKALREGLDVLDEEAMTRLCEGLKLSVRVGEKGQETLLDGQDVSGLIRTPEVSMAASTVSRYAGVRKRMVALQQALAARQDMILDGRDICTTVLPDAPLKIYLTATPEARAQRRYKEYLEKGQTTTFEELQEELRLTQKFTAQGIGVVIGEYGALPGADGKMKENATAYHRFFLDACDAFDLCPLLWDTSGFYVRRELAFSDADMAALYASRRRAAESEDEGEDIREKQQSESEQCALSENLCEAEELR